MTIWSLIKRHLLRERKKIGFIFFSLVTVIAIITALYHLLEGLNEGLSESFDQLGPNIVVSPQQDDITFSYGPIYIGGETKQMDLDDISGIGEIKTSEYVAYVSPKLLDKVEVNGQYVGLIGVDLQTEKAIRDWVQYDGKYPEKENEIMLGFDLANQLEAKVGERVNIHEEAFVVTGVFEKLESEEDRLLFMDLTKAQTLLNRGTEISFVEVVAYCHSCPIFDIAGDIRAEMKNVDVKPLMDIALAREETLDRFRMFFYAVAVIVVTAGCYLLFRLMSTFIRSRQQEIGIFRTIGFTNKLIDKFIVFEALVIGIAGGIIGFLAGMGINALIISIWLQDSAIITTQWENIAFILGLSISMMAISVVGPTRFSATLDPVDALKKAEG